MFDVWLRNFFILNSCVLHLQSGVSKNFTLFPFSRRHQILLKVAPTLIFPTLKYLERMSKYFLFYEDISLMLLCYWCQLNLHFYCLVCFTFHRFWMWNEFLPLYGEVSSCFGRYYSFRCILGYWPLSSSAWKWRH